VEDDSSLPGADRQLRSQAASVMAWVLLPALLAVMDAFSDSLMVHCGPDPSIRDGTVVHMFAALAAGMDGNVRSPDRPQLGPEGSVLFRHLAATHPRFMQACVRNATSASDPSDSGDFGRFLVRWLADLHAAGSARKSAAAGADYARLQLPEWSLLRKAAGCARVSTLVKTLGVTDTLL
jgi:hypothetical protein